MEKLKSVSLVALFAISLFLFNCQAKPKGSALDVEVKDFDGKIYNLMEVKGELILVNFWAMWCNPCKQEIPELIELQNEYKNKGLTVVGISLDVGDAKKVKEFAEKESINYLIYIGNNKTVQRYGGLSGIPASFLVDRQGIIKKRYFGSLDKETVEKDIDVLLSK